MVGGEGLSMLGDAAFGITLAWLVLDRTRSVGALSAVMAVHALPRGVLVLWGGAVTDRAGARTVMLTCHLMRAVVTAALTVLVAAGQVHVGHLVAASALMGVAGAFFTPAAESVLPSLLPAYQYARGNAVQGGAEQVAFLLGPLVGGALTAGLGPAAAIGFDAGTFVVAAATATGVPRRARGVTAGDRSPRTLVREVRAGLRHSWNDVDTRLVVMIVSAATLSYSGVFAVGLPALAASLGSSAAGLAVLVSAWGAGQLLGTLAASATGLPARWGLLVIAMTWVEAAAFVLLGFVPRVWLGAAVLVPLGFGVAYSADVALPTFVQTRTPAGLLGRISAVMTLPRALFEPVSIAALGWALARSVPLGFAAAAVPMLLAGLVLTVSPTGRRLGTTAPARPGRSLPRRSR